MAILNKVIFFPQKIDTRKTKQLLYGGWYQREGESCKERVKEGKYGGNTMYSRMNMEKRDC
jgi:hypothetical protein